MPDLTSVSESVGALLKETGDSLAVSESSCGGLNSATLVAVPGASAYYVGGSVVYTRAAQQGLLDVPESAMEGIRASSEPYAQLNARTIRERLGVTWAVSETGASGPTGNRYGDSAGHACIAVSGPVEKVITVETGDDNREANMWVFAQAALDLHGMKADEAKPELEQFLNRATQAGIRCALVIHGRGKNSPGQFPILKDKMKQWLTRGRLAKMVLAFSTARIHDGGPGAMYILLRRKRGQKKPVLMWEGAKRE